MGESYYDLQSYDYKVIKGDTTNLKFDFYDKDGEAIDIEDYTMTFTVKNPITEEIISTVTKTHNDAVSGGDGIYYVNDVEKPSGTDLTDTNQILIILSYADTDNFEDGGVYPFDVEIVDGSNKFTGIKGYLIVTEEITPSV